MPALRVLLSNSCGVVKDDAKRAPLSGTHAAHAMPEIHPVCAAAPAHWTVMDGENDGGARSQRHHYGAGLHAWPLLGQHEFTSSEIAPGLGEQDRKLQRKHMLTIEILMQAIIVVRAIVAHE